MFRVILLLVLLATSCERPDHPTDRYPDGIIRSSGPSSSMHTADVIPARGKRIDPDSLPRPQTLYLFAPARTVPVRSNIQPAGAPRVEPVARELTSFKPGERGAPLPRTFPARPKIVPAIQPPPAPAAPMIFKDATRTSVQSLRLEQGLNVNYVNTLMEDSRGQMWFGTSNGATRYDGRTFVHYTMEEGLIDSEVLAIKEDSRGRLWFATNFGVTCFDGIRFTQYTMESGLSGNVIWCIQEDSRGDLWFATDQGATRFDGFDFTHYTTDQGLSSDGIWQIMEDSRGQLWFATDRGATRFDGEYFTPYTAREGLTDMRIRHLTEDTRGYLWFGTAAGLTVYDGSTFSHYAVDASSTENICMAMLEDAQSKLYFEMSNGPRNYDYNRFTSKQTRTNSFSHIIEDSQGHLWYRTFPNTSVNRISETGFQYFTKEDGLLNDPIRSMLVDARGQLWFGTHGGGLSRYIPASGGGCGSFVQYASRLRGRHIGAMLEDRRGYLWLGGAFGVYRSDTPFSDHLNDQAFIHYTSREGLSGNNVGMMLEDRKGNIWLGTRINGLTRYTPDEQGAGAFTHFTTSEGLLDNRIRSIWEDRRGQLWIGTVKGVSRYDPAGGGSFTHYTTREGLCGDHVTTIFEDSDGKLWFGAWNNGACRYEPGEDRFTYYGAAEGLSDNSVQAIIEDNRKNIWISTLTGITLLAPLNASKEETLTGDYQLYTFNQANGLKPTGLLQGQACLDRQNRLWWGSDEGLTMLDLNHFQLKKTVPTISLNHVEIAQTFIDYRRLVDTAYRRCLPFGEDLVGAFDSVAPFFNYPLHLTLPYHLNHLTFQFTATDWSAPGMVRYSYLVEGLDKSWSRPGPDNKADYRNLPPGQYKLKVKAISMASGADGWSDVFEYPFTIRPPLWRTWWAYGLYAVLILSALYGLQFYERRRYQALSEARRLKEIDAFKTNFYTNITHEFRTPLTIIQGLSDQTIEEQGEVLPEKNVETARIVKRNSAQLLTLVNQMLDLRKLESGTLPIHMIRGDVIQYLNYLTESFHSFARNRGVGLHFTSEPDALFIDYDADKLLHIVSNLLSNAIKFTPEGGNVYFSVESRESRDTNRAAGVDKPGLRQTPGLLELKIKDTGIGIAEAELPHIFDRFYQADNTHTRQGEGTGIGLALTRELVKLLGGTIDVYSQLGKGTTFTVCLPITREAPAEVVPKSLISEKVLGFTAPEPLRPLNLTGRQGADDQPLALIIEDNPDVVRYLSACLEKDYQIATALNGRTGVDIALELIPDIIVCDVMMPERDGFEVTTILKNDERTSHIPIILLTARADQESKIRGLRTGADAYLAKPFHREELQVRLEQLIEIRKKMQERYHKLQPSPVETEPATLEDAFLRKVRKAVEDNMSDPDFGMVQLSRAMGISRSQLFRKLKALTGKSTSQVVRSIRLQKARELLETTDLNVSEVGYEVGFNDPSYFTKCFVKEFGELPSGVR